VNRLTALIDNLLDVSRVEAGILSYEFAEVELTSLLEETAARFADQFTAVGSTLEVRSPVHTAWSTSAQAVFITCDALRIEQVVTNLLTNALKYAAGTPVHVDVSATPCGAMIRVQDGGMGIAADKQARIFDRFERAEAHRNISGLGLGLYISKQIVDGHGGRLSLESTVGKGSCFTVELPRRARGAS
jgi:signal transduction histidine kinase